MASMRSHLLFSMTGLREAQAGVRSGTRTAPGGVATLNWHTEAHAAGASASPASSSAQSIGRGLEQLVLRLESPSASNRNRPRGHAMSPQELYSVGHSPSRSQSSLARVRVYPRQGSDRASCRACGPQFTHQLALVDHARSSSPQTLAGSRPSSRGLGLVGAASSPRLMPDQTVPALGGSPSKRWCPTVAQTHSSSASSLSLRTPSPVRPLSFRGAARRGHAMD